MTVVHEENSKKVLNKIGLGNLITSFIDAKKEQEKYLFIYLKSKKDKTRTFYSSMNYYKYSLI